MSDYAELKERLLAPCQREFTYDADKEEAAAAIDAMERERDELAAKIDAITSGDWSKARLVRIENGQLDFSGGPVAFIAEYLSQVMEADEGYHNNMEVRVSHPKAGPMVLTLQRVYGETPAQQRKEAIARAEAAEARVKRLEEALRFYAEGEWPEDYPGGVLYAAGDDTDDFKTHIDCGNRARAALQEDKSHDPAN